MRILMLGNSYIFTNDLPSMLAEITVPKWYRTHAAVHAYVSS